MGRVAENGANSVRAMKTLVLILLRIAVSALFFAAGALKLRDSNATLVSIYQYRLLSWEASGILAALLPFVEITGALSLWIPRLRLGACGLCTGLNLIFIAALGSALLRNLDVSCGCFGTSDLYTSALRRVVEDVLLLLPCTLLLKEAVLEARARLQSPK